MAKRILFQEFIELDDAEIALFEEADQKSSGFLGSIKGVAHRVGRITRNGTLYRRSLMHREVERIQPAIKEGKITALADHPSYDGNQVLTLAVRWTKVLIDGNHDMKVEGGILKTSAGREVQAAQEGGVKFALSLRGWGSAERRKMEADHPEFELNREREGDEFWEVADDFELETPADIVLNPSSEGSWTEDRIKEAFSRLEAAITTDDPEEDLMDIKDLKSLRESASAEAVETITAELTEGMIKAEDAEAQKTEAVEAAVAEATTPEKIAESAGLSPRLIEYAQANLDKLEACAEVGFDLDALDPEAQREQVTEAEQKINALTEGLDKANAEIETLKAEREKAENALRDQRNEKTLREMVEKATVGGRWADMLTESAMDALSLPDEFDGSEDAVKTAETMIESYLSDKRAEYERIAGNEAPPKPKGNPGEDGDENKAEKIKAAREDFAKDYPGLVPSAVNFDTCRAAAHREGMGNVFDALYGEDAVKAAPLG